MKFTVSSQRVEAVVRISLEDMEPITRGPHQFLPTGLVITYHSTGEPVWKVVTWRLKKNGQPGEISRAFYSYELGDLEWVTALIEKHRPNLSQVWPDPDETPAAPVNARTAYMAHTPSTCPDCTPDRDCVEALALYDSMKRDEEGLRTPYVVVGRSRVRVGFWFESVARAWAEANDGKIIDQTDRYPA